MKSEVCTQANSLKVRRKPARGPLWTGWRGFGQPSVLADFSWTLRVCKGSEVRTFGFSLWLYCIVLSTTYLQSRRAVRRNDVERCLISICLWRARIQTVYPRQQVHNRMVWNWFPLSVLTFSSVSVSAGSFPSQLRSLEESHRHQPRVSLPTCERLYQPQCKPLCPHNLCF